MSKDFNIAKKQKILTLLNFFSCEDIFLGFNLYELASSLIELMITYVSLTFLHHISFLKRRDCLRKRNVFPCNVAVLSTSSANRSPLSRTLLMLSIMATRTYHRHTPNTRYISPRIRFHSQVSNTILIHHLTLD